MRVNFTARHYKPSERLKEYAKKEVQRLEKFYDGIIDCDIILDYQRQLQIAEIIIHVYGTKLAVVEKTDDIYKSIDFAVAKLERKLKKYKTKLQKFDNTKVTSVVG